MCIRDSTSASAAATGPEVQIDTVPPGASIWVAGALRGEAPLTLRFDASTTRLTVEARKPGYVTKRQTIELAGKMSLQLNLQKARRGEQRPRPPANDLMRP